MGDQPERPRDRDPEGVALGLCTDASFCGRVHVLAPARLDGRIEGEITAAGALWIGPDAVIRASVCAPEIIVEGQLEGELRATERIEVRPAARITGTVSAPGLILQEGAIVSGRCLTMRPERD